jgi:hypothetical protein
MCAIHATTQWRTGSPTGRGLRGEERRKYRAAIEETLARYSTSKAVQSALFVASDVLQYHARRDFTTHHATAAHMLRLRAEGVQPREIVQRVCEVTALQVYDARFATPTELDIAMARHILHTRRAPRRLAGGPLLRYVGSLVREQFGLFPYGVCDRINRDVQVRQEAKKAFETGWTLAGESTQIG